MAPPQDATLSLAIIGGGIAGLALALSASQHSPHIPLVIYEAAHAFGEIGAGVAFGPNAVHAMSRISAGVERAFMGVQTGNQSAGRELVYFQHRVGMRGRTDAARRAGVEPGRVILDHVFSEPAAAWGAGMVHRAAFLDAMVALIPGSVRVEFGKRLVSLEERGDGVALVFADGMRAEHAAVVACDGIRSRVRPMVLGDGHSAAHARFSGKYCYRGLIPMDRAIPHIGEEAAANATMYHGYHGHMLTFPVQKGATMNVVAFSSAQTWDSEAWVVRADRDRMRRDFEGWGPAVQGILEMMEEPDIWALFDHGDADAFHSGRVCLAGDAAHATTPHQGSGAGMAVEDGYVMSMLLRNVRAAADFAHAFAAFDRVRRPRTQKVVATSRELGSIFEFEDGDIGDDVEKMRDNISKRMDWIWNNEIDDDVATAVADFRRRTAAT